MAQRVQDLLGRMEWEVLENPSYSSDLSPYDSHVFASLKRSLQGWFDFNGDVF